MITGSTREHCTGRRQPGMRASKSLPNGTHHCVATDEGPHSSSFRTQRLLWHWRNKLVGVKQMRRTVVCVTAAVL